jgi:hypothetical protein
MSDLTLHFEQISLPHTFPQRGYTPLLQAVALGSIALVSLLLSRGAKMNPRDEVCHRHLAPPPPSLSVTILQSIESPPLHLACQNGYLEIVSLLLDHGAPIDQNDEVFDTFIFQFLKVDRVTEPLSTSLARKEAWN